MILRCNLVKLWAKTLLFIPPQFCEVHSDLFSHFIVLACVLLLQEAKDLSSIKPQLAARGINLYGVVLESLGHKEFQKYFDGTLFLDKAVSRRSKLTVRQSFTCNTDMKDHISIHGLACCSI